MNADLDLQGEPVIATLFGQAPLNLSRAVNRRP